MWHSSIKRGREDGDDCQLGEIDDGWAESIPNLEHFDYEKYGIVVPSK